MGNEIRSSRFQRLLDKRLRKVFEGEFNDLPSMIPTLYGMMDSDSAMEEFFEVGSIPDIPAFSGALEYLAIAPGYHNQIEPKEYAGALAIRRKLVDDKKYNVLDGFASGLGEAANRTREKSAVEAFAYAFSSAFTFQTSEEGKSLCNTSHTTKSGVSTASGFSNSGTSALSKTSVAATRVLMRKFKNDIGERFEINPDTIIVPDNLRDTALEIARTPKSLDTAEGNINPLYQDNYKVITYLRLDDYDTNNWFMVDSRMMKKFLIWIDRVKAEFNTHGDFETFLKKVSVYLRYAYGFLNWRFIYGHNVT